VNILITGSEGFIGKNIVYHLDKIKTFNISSFNSNDSLSSLYSKVKNADLVIHLAGVNRPADESEFNIVNANLTSLLCENILKTRRLIPIIFSSSIQASEDNLYGKSKLEAEEILKNFSKKIGNPVLVYRLPNIFGKWCKPNYNSVVATYCYNIANNNPIKINDKSKILRLVYVDDLVSDFIKVIKTNISGLNYVTVNPEYSISLKELACQIYAFKNSRENLITEQVGTGLVRALYSTYLSYLPPKQFSYLLDSIKDERGAFVEMLKTRDSGQFSYFTAHPGVTRGGHYHHSKSEKFLVINGNAKFRFRNIVTNEKYELVTSGSEPRVVESSPGWAHDITNIGSDEMIVMLWANEIFNVLDPDTEAYEV